MSRDRTIAKREKTLRAAMKRARPIQVWGALRALQATVKRVGGEPPAIIGQAQAWLQQERP